ncbi:lytic murein transglycosylase [Pseudochelatococcus contaminans]|uniref:Lytic murein transglycosylase n=1 Tax=Pseudochelatococcus contaminans TaxID=1538103 RepID=A0A7W6EGK6_9HYPH|nr:lytic murein transglycosylase [Pseudochelatococcus contaminans]MBB3809077.1 lytic murein transglycosylase [Pseudochelatococcus contaminans]
MTRDRQFPAQEQEALRPLAGGRAYPAAHLGITIAAATLLASCSSFGFFSATTVDTVTTASIPASRTAAPAPAMPYVSSATQDASMQSFSDFTRGLWPEASARGVSRRTFDTALAGVEPNARIIALTKKQSEFVKPVWDYLESATSAQRLSRGRAATTQWRETFVAVEQRFGVDRKVIAGVWGMETNFGSTMGSHYVIEALATLAHAQYRGPFFRNELLTALKILDEGHINREGMIGSWAGAMGQTQFMPTSFMRYAVDFTGEGRRDIWTSVPDALASTGNYLREHGWVTGLPWGFEVKLPQNYNYRQRNGDFGTFASAGVRRMDGKAMPRTGEARLFMPAGARGPVFLVTKNFDVIKRYNNSDSYALGVALLGDMIHGGQGVQAAWPRDEKPLSRNEREDLQRYLARLGYPVGEPDGRIGTQTRAAITAYQEQRGLVPDGHPSTALLAHLRRNI